MEGEYLTTLASTVKGMDTPAVIGMVQCFLKSYGYQRLNETLLKDSDYRLFLHGDEGKEHVLLVAPSPKIQQLGVFAVSDIPKDTWLGEYGVGCLSVYGELCFNTFVALFPSLHPYAMESVRSEPVSIVDWRDLTGQSIIPATHLERQCLDRAFVNPKFLTTMSKQSFALDTDQEYKNQIVQILREDNDWDPTWESSLNVDYLDRFVTKFRFPVKMQSEKYGNDIPFQGFSPRLNQGNSEYALESLGAINCKFVSKSNDVWIQTTQDIKAGTEILIDYGKKYWESSTDIAVESLRDYLDDSLYREMILNLVSSISVSCLSHVPVFCDRQKDLTTLLESIPVCEPAPAPTKKKKHKKQKLRFKKGDLLMYWDQSGSAQASEWPCVVLSQSSTSINVQWLSCWYPEEFALYFGATASLNKKTLKSLDDWFVASPGTRPDPRDLKRHDFYYLKDHFDEDDVVPKTLSALELSTLKEVMEAKKSQLKPIMDANIGKNIFVDQILKANHADVLSIVQQCGTEALKSKLEVRTAAVNTSEPVDPQNMIDISAEAEMMMGVNDKTYPIRVDNRTLAKEAERGKENGMRQFVSSVPCMKGNYCMFQTCPFHHELPFEQRKAEQDRLAKEKADRLAKEKADRLAKEKAEQDRLAKEKAEQDRLAKEKADRIAAAKSRYEKKKEKQQCESAAATLQRMRLGPNAIQKAKERKARLARDKERRLQEANAMDQKERKLWLARKKRQSEIKAWNDKVNRRGEEARQRRRRNRDSNGALIQQPPPKRTRYESLMDRYMCQSAETCNCQINCFQN